MSKVNFDLLQSRFEAYIPTGKNYRDDVYAAACVQEAFTAAKEGNFGIGAVLADPSHQPLLCAHNRVFFPRFRSDGHAEMLALREFESRYPRATSMRGYKLYTSLEPCMMCAARLAIAGCEIVSYVAADDIGGVVRRIDTLPGIWPALLRRIKWEQAECSPVLRKLAWQIFEYNVKDLNAKLKARLG